MRPGEPWGEPLDPSDEVVDVHPGGIDMAIAIAAGAHPGAVLRFRPVTGACDFAQAIGLTRESAGARTTVLPCDLMEAGPGLFVINAVVLGPRPDWLRWWHRTHPVTVEVDGRPVGPDRATTVVIANGQFVRGTNLSPRGHPGDGRVEVQVYALRPGERRAMRARLATGEHVPHPRITLASGRRVVVRWGDGPRPADVDGREISSRDGFTVDVRPGAARVLI